MKEEVIIKNNIDTSADSNIKGMGLQKLRATERLLEAIILEKQGIYCTIEYVDDVIEMDFSKENTCIQTEQNKNYKSAFSINSDEVKNSLRIFLDTWRRVEYDENMTFMFYTNTSIAKEKSVGVIKKLGLKLPKEPVLKLLISKEYDQALPIIVPVLKDYYISQHNTNSNSKEDAKFYENLINGYSDETWKTFFQLIEWKFNEENEKTLRFKLESTVKNVCDKLDVDSKYSDKILSCILQLIEEKSLEKNFLNRMVSVSDIKLLFKDFERKVRVEERIDPVHKKWDELDKSDIRDLEEKIKSVCPNFDEDDLEDLQTDFAEGKFEQDSYREIKAVKAYNYRIYNICRRRIRDILKKKDEYKFSEEEINNILDELTQVSEKHILDKAKTYEIPYKDTDMVKKSILILFQECFLALDEVGVKHG